ncbi:hypothetical protein K469DRAFT_683361 [Zopfia rhizophila CBS 207.26]|uniref:AMP-dependent synthetase/ligase domain-containing protein n=1 Tax=Zopfia rhizophila CBS 207.26 TaxID=1314779 RepID=A0A6A6DD43_9PEZI|nr:hypothetical protein K469DRAFT_683361 [Zopfia rhizophila CBS 207.26]
MPGGTYQPPTPSSIEDLPTTDTIAYWAANNQSPPQTFTTPFTDGTVMRSGGSTGAPKIIYMTRAEQKAVAVFKAAAMAQGCGFVTGHRVAHMSHFGGLYGSFNLFNTAPMELPVSHVHLPISGNETIENTIKWVFGFGATVLLSNPSTARQIADRLTREGKTMDRVRLISYTGELFTKGLRAPYKKAFPNALIYPSLYGCVDAGPIGIPPRPNQGGDDDIAPKYKVLAPLLVMEIIDEHGKPIKENGKKGMIVISHLIKRQQPMLRYPTGNVASWTDYSNEVFELHGRDLVSLKIVNAHLPIAVLRETIEEILGEGVSQGSQFVTRRLNRPKAHELTIRIVAKQPDNPEDVRQKINARLGQISGKWVEHQKNGYIAPLRLEWISVDQLQLKSSGKVSDIVEERF